MTWGRFISGSCVCVCVSMHACVCVLGGNMLTQHRLIYRTTNSWPLLWVHGVLANRHIIYNFLHYSTIWPFVYIEAALSLDFVSSNQYVVVLDSRIYLWFQNDIIVLNELKCSCIIWNKYLNEICSTLMFLSDVR